MTRVVCGMLVVVGPVPVYSVVTASGGARRRLFRALILMRWAWEMPRLTSGSPCRGNLFRAARTAFDPWLVDPEPPEEVEDARVAPHVFGELVVPAVGEVVEQLAVLLASVHGRAVGVPFADQAVYEALELFGQVLKDDAVRFDGHLDGTVASASRILETGTHSEAITKSCTDRQLRLDNNSVT